MLLSTPSVPAILGTIISFLVLDMVAVILRFYTRARLKQRLQTDDWLMLPSIALIIACCSILFYGIESKTMGYPAMVAALYHDPNLAEDLAVSKRSDPYAAMWSIVTSRKLEHSFMCLLVPTLGLIKSSVLFLYRRIFVVQKGLRDPRNVFITAMIVLTILWSISFTFAIMFDCGIHFSDVYYDYDLSARVCVNTLDLGYWFAITDFITDALIILIPIPFVWRLHLPVRQRLAVMCVFLMGILATVASILRLASQVWVRNVGFDPTFDEELILTQELFWGILEAAVALIACCLPTLRALANTPVFSGVLHSFRSVFSLRSRSSPVSSVNMPSPSLPEYHFQASEKGDGFIVKAHTVSLEPVKKGEIQEV